MKRSIHFRIGGRKYLYASLVSSVLFPWLASAMWSPRWVEWAVNGKAMADAGVWSGIEALSAQASYAFIHLYGRTIAVVGLMVVWVLIQFLLSQKIFMARR